LASLFTKKLNGVLVPHHKHNIENNTVTMPVPDRVYISMSQHMGPPCEVKVAVNDTVKVGQVIGDSTAFLSAPIHSSVSGKVVSIDEITTSNGSRTKIVVIETDKLQTVDESVKPPVVNNHQDFVKAVKASGLVGLGGAGFPTHIKYNPKNLNEVDTLVINAAECEPYITSDYRTMMEDTDYVVKGIYEVKKYLNLKNVYIGIEDNKPNAIKLLKEKFAGDDSVKVVSCKTLYPQGAEKVMIFQTTGRIVGEGKLPADVGVIVSNVTSVAFVAKYLETGMPLISKRITVDGRAVNNPQNVNVLIGTRFIDIINFCGGYKTAPKKILMGGPMMGIAIYDDTYPLLKNNNALLVFDETQAREYPETDCIRCGKCANTCPFELMPAEIERALKAQNIELLEKLKVMSCMECGSCAYACPAKRHLVMTNRLAKKMIREKGKR